MAAKKEDKVVSLEQAAGLVRDGDVVGLQGMGTQMAPMGMIRELIRAGKKRLKVVQLVGGIGMDWMIAAGCVEKVSYIIVNLDEFGMANNFRREVEAGRLEVEEYTEHQFLTLMQAGAKGLSFGVTRSGLGSQLLETHPDITKAIDCPFTGEKVIAVRALEPDVTILHAHRADKYGNVQFFPKPIWTDVDVFPRAAKKVIVTVEEIVDTDEIRRTPIHTGIPYFKVDAIVELPFGAHPCSLYPQTVSIASSLPTTRANCSRRKAQKKFLDKYVLVKSHASICNWPAVRTRCCASGSGASDGGEVYGLHNRRTDGGDPGSSVYRRRHHAERNRIVHSGLRGTVRAANARSWIDVGRRRCGRRRRSGLHHGQHLEPSHVEELA